ncbi:hypothetical protein BHE90_017179 [Fusarium euwallaceae]|uniref:Uncharacterized protein n=1 Tax=Fusarium euwallaceae TaxID=1147111 RepID=A0A430KYG1_9HYPO|nr:hypothetical protein BHE90_017179 [Fusarium euwallaceae]
MPCRRYSRRPTCGWWLRREQRPPAVHEAKSVEEAQERQTPRSALEAQVILPLTILPMEDFRFSSNTLVFQPKQKTAIWATPLHLAAYFGMNDLIPSLLKYSEVDLCPKEGIFTPLYFALINGHLDTAELLLKNGASPHAEYGIGPLHAAARSGLVDVIDGFVRVGVDVNSQSLDGVTPTVFALYLPEERAIETISHLFERGADVDPQFGPGSCWGLSDLAWAMKKPGLASWLKARANSIYLTKD